MASTVLSSGATAPRASRPVSAERVGVIVGFACITAGGLVAAMAGPLQLAKGSWLAAYLVLIGGLAQLLLSRQAAILHVERASRPVSGSKAEWGVLWLWVLGNAAVATGSLLDRPFVVDAGGIALVVALVIALVLTRGSASRLLAWVFRVAYAAVLVSIPIGLVLAHVRAG